jgi:hypothetical protein
MSEHARWLVRMFWLDFKPEIIAVALALLTALLLVAIGFAMPAQAAVCAACHWSPTPSRFDLIRPPVVVPPIVFDPPLGDPVGNVAGGAADPVPLEPTPEPGTLLLLGSSLAGIGWWLRRR